VIREIALILIFATTAIAEPVRDGSSLSDRLSTLIRVALTEKIAGAEIRIPALGKLFSKAPMSEFAEIKKIHLLEDRANGTALFEVLGVSQDQRDLREVVQTPYEAWKRAAVAVRRIYPNTKLRNEDFRIQEVNVATGVPREFRGVMLPPETKFDGLQTKQSILENQFAIVSAIERQPDIRKGDTVKLELSSGDLTLTTQALVEESALVGERVRVMTLKSKKEIIGRVKPDHSVEVAL
jgi:flagella basal body P-ring formation protein FlgA